MSKRNFFVFLKNAGYVILFLFVLDFFGAVKHFFELDYESEFNYPMHGDVLRYAHQIRWKKAADAPPINLYNYTFISNCSDKCVAKDASGGPQLTILIKSATSHSQRRATIRQSWGNEAGYGGAIRTVFLLGTSFNSEEEESVNNEYEQFKDIVRAHFVDSYYNNTIKTMIGFRWVAEHCSKSWYYMFVDDDYFISIKNIIRFLNAPSKYPQSSENSDLLKIREPRDATTLYAGFVVRSSPLRHKSSKWYIGLDEYPFDMWPPYITAGAYVLSHEALMEMYYMSMYTKHFKFDDIYLGILALRAKVNVTHNPEFHFDKASYSKPWDYRNVVASHGYNDHNEMMRVWTECRSAGYA